MALAQIFFVSCAVLLTGASVLAQDTSSTPSSSSASASSETVNNAGPGAALKGALSAACSQNQIEFVRFLTARNKEAFSRMTPPARLAFMKRFLLLNELGKASVSTHPAARPIRCFETADV